MQICGRIVYAHQKRFFLVLKGGECPPRTIFFVSSDRSSYSDDGLLYIRQRQWQQLFQIFTQSLDAIDVTSVTLSCLNSINAIDVTRYLGDIFGHLGDTGYYFRFSLSPLMQLTLSDAGVWRLNLGRGGA